MKSLEDDITKMIGGYMGSRQVSKKISTELEQKIKVANRQWGKAKDSILDVYRQALKDGWKPVEAAKICREKLTIFSPRTIRGILPDEAKNQEMKREPQLAKAETETQPQIAESLPQIVTSKENQSEINKLPQQLQQLEEQQQPCLHPGTKSDEEEKEAKEAKEDEYPPSPITVEQERKHDDLVDDQYHHARSLIEKLTGIDYVKEHDGNLALVEKTREHRFRLVKQLSDLDVKTIYTDGRALTLILNDYMKQLEDELDVRQAKEKLVSE